MKKIGLSIALATQLFFSSAAQQLSQQQKDSLYTTINNSSIGDSLISNLSLTQVRTGLLDAMNAERSQKNTEFGYSQYNPFSLDSTLTEVAQRYATHMDSTKHFDHIDEKGRDAGDRVRILIPDMDTKYSTISENIARGQNTINEILFDRMHRSSSHRLSVLSGVANRVGIGYYNGVCVVIFGATYE